MTASCQIACTIPWLPWEQLPYPPKYPQISRIRRRDKSNLPLPVLSYKYFLLGYSFSIASFYSPNSAFLAVALFESSKNSNKNSLQQLQVFDLLPYEEMAINFIVPEVSVLPFFYTFTVPLFIRNLSYRILFLFVLLFIPKNLGFGWQDRYSYRSTPSLMPWSTRELGSHRSHKCRDKQNPF